MHHLTNLSRATRFAFAFLAAFVFVYTVRGDGIPVKLDSSWSFNVHTEFPGASGSLTVAPDGSSLKLAYDFTKGGMVVSADRTLDTSATLTGFQVRTRNPGAFGMTFTDSTDQTFVYQLGSSDDGERTLSINFTTDKPWLVHGGPEDKKIHFPLKSLTVIVSKSTEHMSGTVEVTEILLQPVPPASATP